MASSSIQGFLKSANLLENTQDRQALNNLGTAPVADDISLFINNNQNVSTIQCADSEYNFITGLVTLVNSTPELFAARSAVGLLILSEKISMCKNFVTSSLNT